MKKKIYSLLLMLVCVFALSACGEEVKVQKDTSKMNFAPQMVITLVTAPDQPGVIYDYDNVDEFEHYLRQMNSSDVSQMLAVVAGWKSYQASIEDIGIEDVANPPIDTNQMYFKQGKDDGVIAVYNVDGQRHHATIEFAYNSYDELQSVTVNVQLPLNEAMRNAAQNTAIGMGTVFVMLIVIMFIISAFKIIPTLQEAFAKNEEAPAEASVDKAIEGIIEREAAEDETDDNELIAVIAAAIAAAEAAAGSSAETSTEGFVVRSIRRIK
jgi:Na+-transporting methylmalonyl-CoA/oxaloacetate decarboxylase gamma subunit